MHIQTGFSRLAAQTGQTALPKLKSWPKRLQEGIQQQIKEEPLLFWIGLMGVPAAFLTPSTTYYDLRRRPEINGQERHLLVTQEILRQTISALTHFITYYGSIILIGLNLKEGSKYKSLKQLLGATIVTTIGNGVLRPLITNEFLAKHARHREPSPLSKQKNPYEFSSTQNPFRQRPFTFYEG
ncbi:MAG: hypothetical protein VKJ04_03225 [Vampirovibrionales bacterium]|nr:hypothetical protein [Vampirovibrionales bacterium]